MYFLYTLVITLGLLVTAPYFLLQGIRRGKNVTNIPERLGLRFPPELSVEEPQSPAPIWLHAVSVGELLAAVPLAHALKKRYPNRRLVVSTTTETGQALARERMKFADAIFYFPLDLPGPMRRSFQAVRPHLVVVMETEIWPNFLRVAREYGAPVVYANGRISDRSFRGFKRWVVPGFRRRVFAEPTLYLMQSEQDAKRAIELGAPSARVIVTGNLKYDLATSGETPFVSWLRDEVQRSGRGPLLVAGSILAGEEEPVLGAFQTLAKTHRKALLVIAPRRPERFSEWVSIIEKPGFQVIRRTQINTQNGASAGLLGYFPEKRPTVMLLDTLGELAPIYQLADAVFIGGSLVPSGGHNPLEPAAFAKVPVFGPSMENFQEIANQFLSAGAALQVGGEKDLASGWMKILADHEASAEMGQKARALVERHRGATAATLGRLVELLERGVKASR